MDWTNRPVLVTGATGLLGGWLVEQLLDRGAYVVCLVRDSVPMARLVEAGLTSRVVTVSGDVCDQAKLERVMGEYEIRTVFHLAAQTIVTIANRNPVGTFDTNIRGTWTLLEACRRSPLISEIIVASSDKAYGDQIALPYSEKTPLQGSHPYDVSKSCADLIAQTYANTWGVPVAITRCGNFFGGGDLNFNRLIPGTIRDALAGRTVIIRSDGLSLRDYIFVEDGAAAYIALAEALASDRNLSGRAFNFSLERPMTVQQMVDLILNKMNSSVEVNVLNEASNEIAAQYLDSSQARHDLGWSPAFTLEEGIERTIDWYQRYLGGTT